MSICKLLKRIEHNEINVGRLEIEKGLASGRPVYYGDESLQDGEVIKEYPDSKKEVVTFDHDTGEEIFLRDF